MGWLIQMRRDEIFNLIDISINIFYALRQGLDIFKCSRTFSGTA